MAIGMTEDEKNRLLAHLNNRWTSKVCPMCRKNNWEVAGMHSVMLQESRRTLNLGGPLLPCAVVTCRNCGNTLFVNMIVAGVYDGSGE